VGRDWFAQQVAGAGGQCEFVVAYQRLAPVWSLEEKNSIIAAASDGSFWLLSSTEALGNLIASLPEQHWQHAKAVATHSRIAKAAHAAGFGTVLESRPMIQEVIASIESSL
jgi:uroporphyrinogen-III synthase